MKRVITIIGISLCFQALIAQDDSPGLVNVQPYFQVLYHQGVH